jgi:hypothetical protein
MGVSILARFRHPIGYRLASTPPSIQDDDIDDKPHANRDEPIDKSRMKTRR